MRLRTTLLALLLVSSLNASSSPRLAKFGNSKGVSAEEYGNGVTAFYARKIDKAAKTLLRRPGPASYHAGRMLMEFRRPVMNKVKAQGVVSYDQFMVIVNATIATALEDRINDLLGRLENAEDVEFIMQHIEDLSALAREYMSTSFREYEKSIQPPEIVQPVAVKPAGPLRIANPASVGEYPSVSRSFAPTPESPKPPRSHAKKWQKAEFIDELIEELNNKLFPRTDILYELQEQLGPSLNVFIQSFESFPRLLAVSGFKIRLIDLGSSFEQILADLQEFFELTLVQPMMERVEQFRSFESQNDWVADMIEQRLSTLRSTYQELCRVTLTKYFQGSHQQSQLNLEQLKASRQQLSTAMDDDEEEFGSEQFNISSVEDYMKLATRLDIDPSQPELLMSNENSRKLKKLGIDIGDPAFQSFINDVTMHLAAESDDDEDEEDEPLVFNILPRTTSPRREPAPATLKGTSARRYSNNVSIVKRLRAELDKPQFVSQMTAAVAKALPEQEELAEGYVGVILDAVADLLNQDLPLSDPETKSRAPPTMKKLVQRTVSAACASFDEMLFQEPLYGPQVAEEILKFLGSVTFVRDEKAQAVANWNLTLSRDEAESENTSGSSVKPSPLQKTPGSVKFSESPFVKDFDHKSPASFVGLFEGEIEAEEQVSLSTGSSEPQYRQLTYNIDNYPVFPFEHPQDLLERPAFLTETADYLHQNGETLGLQLQNRLDSLEAAMSEFLDTKFVDTEMNVRDEIHEHYRAVAKHLFNKK